MSKSSCLVLLFACLFAQIICPEDQNACMLYLVQQWMLRYPGREVWIQTNPVM
jgi:hypothetical protein